MRFKITALGGVGRPVTDIAAAIVSYLREQTTGDRSLNGGPQFEDGAGRYYSDGTDEAGRWLGLGAQALGLRGMVDDDEFASVLAGRDPQTGERLITAQGSAGRRPKLGVGQHSRMAPDGRMLFDSNDAAAAVGMTVAEVEGMLDLGELLITSDASRSALDHIRDHAPGSYLVPAQIDGQRWVTEEELERCIESLRRTGDGRTAAAGDPNDDLSITEAAKLTGVSPRYLRRLARSYEMHGEPPDMGVQGLKKPAYLVARRRSDQSWTVKRRDLVAYIERREPPAVRVGFDATLTTEKSLGVLALLSGGATRRVVLSAIQEANDCALRWLEANHAVTRERGEVVEVKGWTVASFRHYTSRALDPFPHLHNVVLNTVEDHAGVRRALDARRLYVGAHGASALATAEMRHRLSRLLGVRWRRSRHGGWEIDGIPEPVLREFSRRRNEIEEALRELEEAIGRGSTLDEVDQIAKTTRPPKTQAAVDHLVDDWWQRAEALGFFPDDLEACVGQPVDRDEPDLQPVFAELAGANGICENLSVFNKGDLLNTLVDLPLLSTSGETPQPICVSAARLEAIADQFLASPWVEVISEGNEVRLTRYSTREMLAVQERVVARHSTGLRIGAALVPRAALLRALEAHPHLTDEQAELVTSFCTSGDRFACAVGRPGTGKTTAMLAAREAWEAAGLRVVGAAVKGEAARGLAEATGIPTETLAWHLAQDDPLACSLDARTVLVVDEASTVSDRDLDRLGWLAERTGAAIRLIGDPVQHGAVAAGGMFRVLCELHPENTPELTRTHRLRDPHDRDAADALRAGDVTSALTALAAAGHLHIVEDELGSYVGLLTRWWHAHLAGNDHPMVDRTNSARKALNRLAHALREANGELSRDHIESHDRRFAVGDHVIARIPDRHLYPPGEPSDYVRNGARGTVAAIRHGGIPDDDVVVVAFDGIGTIDLPRSFFDEHQSGRGHAAVGLDYAYAVTSYAVTGSTLPVSTSRISETSSRAETYVDITRGRFANHVFVTRAADPLEGEHLPRVPAEPIAQAVADQLAGSQGERTAWEIRRATQEEAEPIPTLGI